MTDFLSLFTIFCGSDVFESLIIVTFVPVLIVSLCLSLVGVIIHGKCL